MKKFLLFFVFAGFISSVSGQDFFKTNVFDTTRQKGLFFDFESTGFFKNNEFESDVVKGYTLTGTWLRPKLVLRPSGTVQLALGWHYLQYNGAEKATWSIPWLSAKILLSDNWQFTLGNLSNSRNHRLISPVWEPERFLSDKPEAGFQFLHNTEKTYIDAWINWEQFITRGDPFQEHFAAGISTDFQVFQTGRTTFSAPIQMLAYHMGGEIDSSPLHVQTLMNFAGGVKAEIGLDGFFRSLNLAGYLAAFRDSKGNSGLPFSEGSGFYSSNWLDSKAGKIGMEYWSAKNFFSVKGMSLLQIAQADFSTPENFDPRKNMFSVFYEYSREISRGVDFGFRFDGWFEPGKDNFSNMASLYIVVNQEFLLKKIE